MSGSGRVRVLKKISGSGQVGFPSLFSGFFRVFKYIKSWIFGFVKNFSSSRVRVSKKPSGWVGFSGVRVPDPSLLPTYLPAIVQK